MQTKQPVTATPWVDLDHAPPLAKPLFEQADPYKDGKPVRRGRPPTGTAKQLLSLRVDDETIRRLRALGPGWQTRAVEALAAFAQQESES